MKRPGSQGIPDSIAPYCRDYNALLLANHGAVAWGKSLMEAWYRLESTEHYAMVIMYTGNIIGKANVLSCEQVSELIEIRKKLGITSGGIPPCTAHPTNTVDVVAGHSRWPRPRPCSRPTVKPAAAARAEAPPRTRGSFKPLRRRFWSVSKTFDDPGEGGKEGGGMRAIVIGGVAAGMVRGFQAQAA